MNIETLQAYCLSKTGAEETQPFGPETLVYKVGGKMFLLASPDALPLRFNVKCKPDDAIILREQHSSVLPGYHMNKLHWNTVIADGTVNDKLMQQWIDDSYHLIVDSLPKKIKEQLT